MKGVARKMCDSMLQNVSATITKEKQVYVKACKQFVQVNKTIAYICVMTPVLLVHVL